MNVNKCEIACVDFFDIHSKVKTQKETMEKKMKIKIS